MSSYGPSSKAAGSPARDAAVAIQAGRMSVPDVVDALQFVAVNRRRPSVLETIANEVVVHFGEGRRALLDELEHFLSVNRRFCKAFPKTSGRGWSRPLHMQPDRRMPRADPADLPWPTIVSVAELADWLGLHDDELLALTRIFGRDSYGVRRHCHDHYHRHWIARRGAPPRLLEAPKQRLKEVQQRIARLLLRRVPAHGAAHGFVVGRSVESAVAAHAGRRCVLRMDVEDCFASFGRGRVLRVFLTLGYPEAVAHSLASICTTAAPVRLLQELRVMEHERANRLHEKLRVPHLPQGAPTSPALANLSMHRVDARLAGLARKFGASYSRYADDLLFSGEHAFARDAERCSSYAAAILLEEGLHVAHHKTRVMGRGMAQRSCGLVLNEYPTLPRRERQLLEAILFNCVQHGPSTQNRSNVSDFRAHLQGRVAYARRFDHSGRLQLLFDRINWTR